MPAPNFEHDAMNYLQFMFHQADPNIEHICVTRQSKNDAWFNCAPGDDDFAKWTQIDNDEAWYVVVASIDGEINAKGTMVGRGQDHLVRYHILMLDDIGDSVGSKAVEPPVRLWASAEGHVAQRRHQRDPGWGNRDPPAQHGLRVEHGHQERQFGRLRVGRANDVGDSRRM